MMQQLLENYRNILNGTEVTFRQEIAQSNGFKSHYDIGQIFVVLHGKNLKNNLGIWSFWGPISS